MTQVDIDDAKTNLESLLERAAAGEEIVVTRAGDPVARIVALAETSAREPGSLRGQVVISPDFDADLPEDLLAAFEDAGSRQASR